MDLDSTLRNELYVACERVERALRTSYEYKDAQTIIGRYTGTFAGNFIAWIGMTYPWVYHELAAYALKDNLRCEQSENHVGMLLRFASHAKVTGDSSATQETLEEIREVFRDTGTAGLFGTALLATLEVTSQKFIPVLEDMGVGFGLSETRNELEYTRSHGPADAKHAATLTEALIAEAGGYEDPMMRIRVGINLAVTLIEKIFIL